MGDMFAPWCPTCRRRMLLGSRRVEAIERTTWGPRVVLRCFCGTPVVWSPHLAPTEYPDPVTRSGSEHPRVCGPTAEAVTRCDVGQPVPADR